MTVCMISKFKPINPSVPPTKFVGLLTPDANERHYSRYDNIREDAPVGAHEEWETRTGNGSGGH